MTRPATILCFLLCVSAAVGETRVRIVGTQNESEAGIMENMGGRLEHVIANPASPSRADDAAFLVRQVLRKDGYAEVRVDWKINGPSEIILTVTEGSHLTMGSVTINGVRPSFARKLARLYRRPAERARRIIARAAPFREEDVETGLSYIRQELNSYGHWNAQTTIQSRVTDPATGSVNFTIDVDPGPLFRIENADITSTDGRGVSETRDAMSRYIGMTATTGNLNAMRLAVEQAFVSNGYPDASITMTRNLAGSGFTPVFNISLGRRVRLNKIHVEGLVRTNPDRVLNRMQRMEGDWYDEAAMNMRIREFLANGAFSTVRVDTREVGGDRIDATLHLEEARAKEISVAAGADSYLGFILRTTYTDRNLWGGLRGFSVGTEVNSRGVLGETRVTDPWIFGSDVSATARAYALIFGREGYSSLETGVEASATLAVNSHYGIELLAGYSLVNLSSDGLPTSELGETVYYQPRLRFTQTLDFRDSPILPKNGWHLVFPLEIGAAMGNTSSSYAQAELSGGWYRTFARDYEIVLGGAWGVIVPSGDGADLPINLRMFNGGARSVRSFPERELGPRVDGYPTGGEAKWHANVEFLRNIAGSLRAVGFFDAGGLSREYDQLASSKVDLAAGLGLRLDLPIGPVRLEYGYNLTRDIDEPVGTLHFAIGAAF